MSKICEKCGEELKDTARVCTSCGAPAAPPEQPYLNRPVKPTPHITEKYANETDGLAAEKSAEQPKKKNTALKIIIAALLVILLAAGGLFGYLALSGKTVSDFIGTAETNIAVQRTGAAALTASEVKDV